jgi:colicin import membrane protein
MKNKFLRLILLLIIISIYGCMQSSLNVENKNLSAPNGYDNKGHQNLFEAIESYKKNCDIKTQTGCNSYAKINEQKQEKFNEKKQDKRSSLETAIAKEQAEEKDKTMQAIRQKVNRSWIRSPDSENLKCTFRVKLASDGTVLDVSIEISSGDEMFDRSAENAVNNASPLPVPQDKELYEREFKTVTFVFDPK